MECDIEKVLLETRGMLKNSGQTLAQVSEGSGLTYFWLQKFSQGRISEPGISKIVALRNYLNKAA